MPGILGAGGEEAHITTLGNFSSPSLQAAGAGLAAACAGLRTSKTRKPGEGWYVMETWGAPASAGRARAAISPCAPGMHEAGGVLGDQEPFAGHSVFLKVCF